MTIGGFLLLASIAAGLVLFVQVGIKGKRRSTPTLLAAS